MNETSQNEAPLLSVVMPVYNEAATIREILRRVSAVPLRKEIIVVDDGSTDATRKLLAEIERQGLPGPQPNTLRVILQPENRGKGAALATGFGAVAGDIVCIQDADLEYDPAEYPVLIAPIIDGRADAVYGSRFLGSTHRVLFFWHMIGNKLLTLLSNMFTDLNLTDMETGAKAFRADVIKNIPLSSERFGFEPEVTAKLGRMRARIYELPISYSGRSYWQGKKIGWKDGFEAVWTILRCAFDRGRTANHPSYAALQRLDRMYRYNAWVWAKVKGYIGERVLELSAGASNLTPYLLTREKVVISDTDEWYLRMLRTTFGEDSKLELRAIDLESDDPHITPGEFDTVLCLNVLERLEDDLGALRRLYQSLEPGGRLIVMVPAMRALYGSIDEAIGNLRRYERDELEQRLRDAGFGVEEVTFMNAAAAAAWYLNSRLLKRRSLPGFQSWLSDRMVPLLRLEERFPRKRGLSLLAVARKPPPA